MTNLIYLIFAVGALVLLICGIWAHWKIIDVKHSYTTYKEKGKCSHGKEVYKVEVRVKYMGIFMNRWRKYEKWCKYDSDKHKFIRRYTRYI